MHITRKIYDSKILALFFLVENTLPKVFYVGRVLAEKQGFICRGIFTHLLLHRLQRQTTFRRSTPKGRREREILDSHPLLTPHPPRVLGIPLSPDANNTKLEWQLFVLFVPPPAPPKAEIQGGARAAYFPGQSTIFHLWGKFHGLQI